MLCMTCDAQSSFCKVFKQHALCITWYKRHKAKFEQEQLQFTDISHYWQSLGVNTVSKMDTSRFYGNRIYTATMNWESNDNSSSLSEAVDSEEDVDFCPYEEESSSGWESSDMDSAEDSTISMQASTSPTTPQPAAQAGSSSSSWESNFVFSGNHGLKKRISAQNGSVTPAMVFEQFFSDKIIDLMMVKTNRYAQQCIAAHVLRRTSRMWKWVDATWEEMKLFLGVVLTTGLIRFPHTEDYWKEDSLFYHPLFHKIGISYNRFSLLPKNWHVSNNETAPPGDRLYKIADFTKCQVRRSMLMKAWFLIEAGFYSDSATQEKLTSME